MSATPKATITEKAPMMSVTGLKSPDEPGIVEPTTTVYRFSDQPTRPVLDDGPGVDPRQVRAAQLMAERGLDVSKYHGLYTNEQLIIRQQCIDEAFGLGRFAPQEVQTNAPPVVSTEQAREQLRLYITEQDEAENELEKSAAVVDRARNRVVELTGQLEQYRSLDGDILAHKVQSIRADDEDDLPHALAYKMAQRSKLTGRLDHANRALNTLQGEHRAIEANATQVRQKVSQASIALLQTTIRPRVLMIQELEREALRLRKEVTSFGMARFNVGSAPTPPQMTNSTVVLLREPPANATAASDTTMVQRWQDLHKALLADPDADLS